MTLKLGIGRNWLALPTLAGLAAFVACGVEQEKAPPQVTPVLEQTRQGLWVDIYSALGTPVTSGTAYGAANEFTPPLSCSDGSGGSDLSFKWTAPKTATYTFSTTGSVLDSVLHIYTFHNTTATDLLGCNDQENGTLNSSLVDLTLTAGTAVRIVVDSYVQPSSRNGGFQLNITERCPTAPSQCHSAPGTWNGTSCVYPFKAQGTACDDGLACTTGDVCNGSGACGGSSACNSPPSGCFESTGTCTSSGCQYAVSELGTCSDGMGCTRGDFCGTSGQCISGDDICSNGTMCTPNGCAPIL